MRERHSSHDIPTACYRRGVAHEGTRMPRQRQHALRYCSRSEIGHPRDAIIKVTACASCGSDLHIDDGVIPSMPHGDILGHETMGEAVELGSET